jgi:hypothetical protein
MHKIILLLTLSILTGACNKLKQKTCTQPEQHCEQAEVCLSNFTQDTIHYSWGSNILDSILLPGETDCMQAGKVDVTYDKKTAKKNVPPGPPGPFIHRQGFGPLILITAIKSLLFDTILIIRPAS